MIDVVKLVKHLVSIHETRDPFKIARYEGFKVKLEDYADLKGYYFVASKNKYIAVNSSLDEFSRNVVCAHESGHGLMHDTEETFLLKEYTLLPVHTRIEREATSFAAKLMLDDSFDYDGFYREGNSLDSKLFE